MPQPSDEEKRTIEYYENRGRNKIRDTNEYDAGLDDYTRMIFKQMRPGGRLIDVGCGYGKIVPLLPLLGISPENYLGVDVSEAQIDFAHEQHPGHQFEVASIYDLGRRYPNTFDSVWCTSMLMHIPRRRLGVALRSLRGCVKKGAVGVVSTRRSETLDTKDVPTPEGLTLTTYTLHEFKQALARAGFDDDMREIDRMISGMVLAE